MAHHPAPATKKSFRDMPVSVILETIYNRNDSSPVSSSKDSFQKYQELGYRLEKILLNDFNGDPPSSMRDLPFTAVFSLAEMVLYTIDRNEDIMLQVMHPTYPGTFLAFHSLNVAFLSCKVGAALNLSYKELAELATASMLHDLGMIRISEAAYVHDRKLTQTERDMLERHPIIAYRYLEKLKDEVPWLVRTVLEEHKRENNTGYPEEVKGELHLYSRIIGLCDTLESLAHKRHYRRAFHPFDAVRKIVNTKEKYYADFIVRALIEAMSMYPVGSLVRLNNNIIAQVISPRKGAPLKPLVKVLRESNGKPGQTPHTLDLFDENNIYISGIVYDENYEVIDKGRP